MRPIRKSPNLGRHIGCTPTEVGLSRDGPWDTPNCQVRGGFRLQRLKREFGFYPQQLRIDAGPVRIQGLPGLERLVKPVLECDSVEGCWIYAPRARIDQIPGGIRELPYHARVFGLPSTHVIEHASATGPEHLEFHLWALSLFLGVRLTGTEAGFLDSTPIKPGVLVDFRIGASITQAVGLAERFWKTNLSEPGIAKRFGAAVHALFLGQNPQDLQFENFLYLYLALDACYKLSQELLGAPGRNLRHGERIEWMCQQFGIPVPQWADPKAKGGVEVAGMRNDTIHEALFMGAPLGFELQTDGNLTTEMAALGCRLLVALVGGRASVYVRSPVDTAQIWGLDLR